MRVRSPPLQLAWISPGARAFSKISTQQEVILSNSCQSWTRFADEFCSEEAKSTLLALMRGTCEFCMQSTKSREEVRNAARRKTGYIAVSPVQTMRFVLRTEAVRLRSEQRAGCRLHEARAPFQDGGCCFEPPAGGSDGGVVDSCYVH